ncbi:hypothetical protein [Roseomonas sp. KE0001]|uniref:hypothetical protein n=1 Tax=Roseomonas sp. KE0001 TaxID=2479201 RepID=UPI0018DF4145|nr:hypothetical protein [Roseomonas sp. KE0001]MBI0436187.1 hypothetical protein [Roseomonas sp. KE0001]
MSWFAFDAYAWAPQEIGLAIAEQMQGAPTPRFLQHLDERLEDLRVLLLDAGLASSQASTICRAAHQIAREEWQATL